MIWLILARVLAGMGLAAAGFVLGVGATWYFAARRHEHMLAVLEALLERHPLTMRRLGDQTGVPVTDLSVATELLVRRGLVLVWRFPNFPVGHPATLVDLVPRSVRPRPVGIPAMSTGGRPH